MGIEDVPKVSVAEPATRIYINVSLFATRSKDRAVWYGTQDPFWEGTCPIEGRLKTLTKYSATATFPAELLNEFCSSATYSAQPVHSKVKSHRDNIVLRALSSSRCCMTTLIFNGNNQYVNM